MVLCHKKRQSKCHKRGKCFPPIGSTAIYQWKVTEFNCAELLFYVRNYAFVYGKSFLQMCMLVAVWWFRICS